MKKFLKDTLKKNPLIQSWIKGLNNENVRNEFVIEQLKHLKPGIKLLDAGCGSQQYRKYASHTEYFGQDFGQYVSDDKKMFGGESGGMCENAQDFGEGYAYGALDYVGDIGDIAEDSVRFDAILCTEVFEHIPYPNETLSEFLRLLSSGGKLILTAPSNCLRHMDPFYFYSGFSDRWFEHFLEKYDFKVELLLTVGDYYSRLMVELARTFRNHGIVDKAMLAPALIYFSF